uniref:Uncharacterized protein n=1 Tax=Denticeps clupeoides TaxID=299321 RepID=A0AAY4ECG2_9TELE
SHISSSMPLLMEGGFHSKSHNTWPHSFFPLHGSVVRVPLQKNTQKHDVSIPILHSRYGVLWMHLSILSPPNTSRVFNKKPSSGSSQCSLANFRWARTCTGLSRGTPLALQDLSPWRCSVLLMVAFLTLWSQLSSGHSLGPPVWFWDL